MAWNEIPLDTTPDQEIHITVEVNKENIPLILRLRYNTEGEFWRMDVSDGTTAKMLVSNVPLLTGEYPAANLLRQFEHIGIGAAMIVKATEQTERDIPGISDLGTDFVLVWGDNS